jgi:hypothetical protein
MGALQVRASADGHVPARAGPLQVFPMHRVGPKTESQVPLVVFVRLPVLNAEMED